MLYIYSLVEKTVLLICTTNKTEGTIRGRL